MWGMSKLKRGSTTGERTHEEGEDGLQHTEERVDALC